MRWPGIWVLLTLAASLGAQSIASSFPVDPAGVAFVGGLEYDCSGDIVYVVDQTNDLLSVYTSGGAFLKSYPAVPPPGSGLTNPQPIGIGLNSSTGMLWIGDEGEYVYELDPVTGTPTGVSWSTTPAITDVSGVAVDPNTGNIYVSQDSGTRMVVEFDPTGGVVNTIVLTAAGSTDPDGLAYDAATNTFFLGEDTTDTILQVDTTGALVNSWSLAGLGISPEGLGVDSLNGQLYIGDGFVTRMVYVVDGILTPGLGPCIPNPTPFAIAVTTTGAGDATLDIRNIPSGAVEGYTLISLDVTAPVNGGPIFGFSPDSLTFLILATEPVATPGSILHWTWPVAPPLFPAVPFSTGPGALSSFAGQTWDFIALAVTPSGLIPTFNVSRVTW